MPELKAGHIGDYKPDPRNARKHGKKNLDTIERSLQEVGVGRSIVATRDGTILAGNGVLEAAGQTGIEDAIVVHSDGTRLIIHVRDDLEEGDKRATLLGLYDNRASDLSEWDTDTLIEIQQEFQNDPQFDHIFGDKDFDEILFATGDRDGAEVSTESQLPVMEYRCVVDCDSEDDLREFMEEMQAKGRIVKALIT